jgi:hypothetical protein
MSSDKAPGMVFATILGRNTGGHMQYETDKTGFQAHSRGLKRLIHRLPEIRFA